MEQTSSRVTRGDLIGSAALVLFLCWFFWTMQPVKIGAGTYGWRPTVFFVEPWFVMDPDAQDRVGRFWTEWEAYWDRLQRYNPHYWDTSTPEKGPPSP